MRNTKLIAASLLATLCLTAPCFGADVVTSTTPLSKKKTAARPPVTLDAAHKAAAQKLIDGGIAYLLSARNAEDGSWDLGDGLHKPAATAIAVKTLLQHPKYNSSSPQVKQALDFLLSFRQKDGGIYSPKIGYANYTASIALMALAATKDPQYTAASRDLVKYLKGSQIVEGVVTPNGQKITKGHAWVGGSSYGSQEYNFRPDGSNTGMWAQALHEAGVKGDDPAMKRMGAFFTRLQNSTESNTQVWAVEGSGDGGFVYAIGESKAGKGPGDLGLRSYGSLTYMGFKSMLYAGLSRKDPRVQAAFNWIRNHWTLDSNPNMPAAQSAEGLYYYYNVYAKALRAWGEPIVIDGKGVEHNWRHELIDALAKRVAKDGSWVNPKDRWNEGSPVLVTCYAVMAMQETLKN